MPLNLLVDMDDNCHEHMKNFQEKPLVEILVNVFIPRTEMLLSIEDEEPLEVFRLEDQEVVIDKVLLCKMVVRDISGFDCLKQGGGEADLRIDTVLLVHFVAVVKLVSPGFLLLEPGELWVFFRAWCRRLSLWNR